MIKFKLERKPVWVSGDHSYFDKSELKNFPKEERAKVKFKIAPFPNDKLEEIRQDCVYIKKSVEEIASDIIKKLGEDEAKKITRIIDILGGFKPETGFDSKRYGNELRKLILLDWEGLPDSEGNDILFNDDNVYKFITSYVGIANAIVTISQDLIVKYYIFEEKEKKESEKNLNASQSGRSEEKEISEKRRISPAKHAKSKKK